MFFTRFLKIPSEPYGNTLLTREIFLSLTISTLTRLIDPFVHRGYIEQIGLHYTLAHVPSNLSKCLTFLLLFWDNSFSSLISRFFTHFASTSKKSYFFHPSVSSEILSES